MGESGGGRWSGVVGREAVSSLLIVGSRAKRERESAAG